MKSKNFEGLLVWQKARDLRKDIKEITESKFPKKEQYRLTDQIIRSSRSIGNNIAEGHGVYHWKKNTNFCRIARGSTTETLDHLIIAFDEGYITEEILNNFRIRIEEITKLINGYIRFLNNSKMNPPLPNN